MEEKPLECTPCKRKATIVYKKIKDGEIESYRMCSMCPCLQSNIGLPIDDENEHPSDLKMDRKCPNCLLSLHDVIIERCVGCGTCYQVFEDFIIGELSETGAIPLKPDSPIMKKKSMPIHLGGTPKLVTTEETLKKLASLQSALKEAVASENYERAASLRDQIKTLTEHSHGKERKAS